MPSPRTTVKDGVRSVAQAFGLKMRRVRIAPGSTGEVTTARAHLASAAKRSDPNDYTIKQTEILELNVRFFNWNTLLFLFDEIFLSRCYAFEPGHRSPRILDAGANIGMATLWFSLAFPDARITSIEPDPTSFELLKANVEANLLERVTPIQAALAADSGSIELMIDLDKPGALLMSTDARRMRGVPVTVPAIRLSDHVDGPVDLLKLDVEGAEHEIMNEMASSGALAEVQSIAMEYHHHIDPNVDRFSEMLALLERNGYAYHISSGPLSGPLDLGSVATFQDIGVVAAKRRN